MWCKEKMFVSVINGRTSLLVCTFYESSIAPGNDWNQEWSYHRCGSNRLHNISHKGRIQMRASTRRPYRSLLPRREPLRFEFFHTFSRQCYFLILHCSKQDEEHIDPNEYSQRLIERKLSSQPQPANNINQHHSQ